MNYRITVSKSKPDEQNRIPISDFVFSGIIFGETLTEALRYATQFTVINSGAYVYIGPEE